MRGVLDRLLFIAVDVALIVRHPREFWRLFRRNTLRGGAFPSIAAPQVANSKYVWRKLIDHDPRFVTLTDKLAAKAFIRALGISVPMPRTLWQGAPDDLPERYLSADVVIKTAHGWSTNIYPACEGLTPAAVRARIAAAMAQRHGRGTNQWAYYDIPPRLFVEERVGAARGLIDLKVYTYGALVLRVVPIRTLESGRRVAALWVGDGRGGLTLSDQPSAVSPDVIDRSPLPATAARALEVAAGIGAHFDHMRVDFLTDGAALYLGEVTVYNLNGREAKGHLIGEASSRHWDLRRSWFLNTPQSGWRALYARALVRFCDRQARRFPTLDRAGPLPPDMLGQGLRTSRAIADGIGGPTPP